MDSPRASIIARSASTQSPASARARSPRFGEARSTALKIGAGLPDRQGSTDDDTAWGAWFGSLGSAIVDFGHRVGQVTTIAAEGGATDTNVLTGYLVITAGDIDAESRLARGCPGLANGVSVEVAEAADA